MDIHRGVLDGHSESWPTPSANFIPFEFWVYPVMNFLDETLFIFVTIWSISSVPRILFAFSENTTRTFFCQIKNYVPVGHVSRKWCTGSFSFIGFLKVSPLCARKVWVRQDIACIDMRAIKKKIRNQVHQNTQSFFCWIRKSFFTRRKNPVT